MTDQLKYTNPELELYLYLKHCPREKKISIFFISFCVEVSSYLRILFILVNMDNSVNFVNAYTFQGYYYHSVSHNKIYVMSLYKEMKSVETH